MHVDENYIIRRKLLAPMPAATLPLVIVENIPGGPGYGTTALGAWPHWNGTGPVTSVPVHHGPVVVSQQEGGDLLGHLGHDSGALGMPTAHMATYFQGAGIGNHLGGGQRGPHFLVTA